MAVCGGRTPLYDRATFEKNIPNLLRQIEIAATPEGWEDEDGSLAAAGAFSAEDMREELERLHRDEAPAALASTTAGGVCVLPAQVPKLPEGLRITAEMKQLLTALLTSGESRIGFCGMVSPGDFCP